MNRKKNRSLLVMAQSPRPTICRSSKLLPTTRFTKENGTVTKDVPFDTATFWTVPTGCGLPGLIPYGPNDCNAATAVLLGNAVARAVRPAGVGVKLEEVPELRAFCISCW